MSAVWVCAACGRVEEAERDVADGFSVGDSYPCDCGGTARIEPHYPDTAAGARAFLKVASCYSHKRIDAATVVADPVVAGVWLVSGVGDDTDPDAVVELAGYPTFPGGYGPVRERDDFAEGTVRRRGGAS